MAEQKPTEYEPTLAEKRLIEVELNPENIYKSVSEKCRLAKINRSTYYESYKKPEFKELVKNVGLNIIIQNVLPTIHTFARESKRGSFQHGKVLLEMAEMYTEKTEQKIESHEVVSFAGEDKLED
jgi:hypothetical protein